MSMRSRETLMAILSEHYTDVRLTDVSTVADLEELAERKPDLVFLTVKFVPQHAELGMDDTHKVWLPDYLDECGITYTGSNRKAYELELYKPLAKAAITKAGLNTSPFCVVTREEAVLPQGTTLHYPLFIKPTDRGGGLAVDAASLVHNEAEANAKIATIAHEHHSDSLVEEYLTGREYSVAILKNANDGEFMVMPLELGTNPDHEETIMSNETKLLNEEVIIEVTDPVIREAVCTLGLKAFHALGARDYGRIDIRVNTEGVPQFLEANLNPSLIEGYGSFPKACVMNQNLNYEDMILHITRLALARRTL